MEINKVENSPREGEFKMKKKKGRPKKLVNNSKAAARIDLTSKETKTEEDAIQTQETSNSDVVIEEKKDEAGSEKMVEEVRDAKELVEETSKPLIEEISNEYIK